MIHVEKVTVVGHEDQRSSVLKMGFEVICDSINLFVGDQGCGKSTFLKKLQENNSDVLKIKLTEETLINGVDTFYFDTENDNPRMGDVNKYTNPNGTSNGIGLGAALSSHFMSHGEVLKEFVLEPLYVAKDSVIFIDEPESGLSITNQYRFIDAIKQASENGCQFFIATHCVPLIEAFDVISLEHFEKMPGKEFIERVKANAEAMRDDK